MAEVSIRLAVQGGKQARDEFRGTSNEVDRLDGRLSRVGRNAVAAARGLASISGRALGSGLRTVATGAGLLAAGLTSVAAAGATVGIKTAANMEQANIAFTTMLGSGEKARAFLSDLNKFAAKTPFDFPGLQSAASSLISAGIDANKVIPIMTSLGNATSGMGTGAEGVQRATVALQQMSAAGRITGEDLNQLRDAGIPVFDLLAAATGKSVTEVAALAQAGKLGKKELDQLMGALESGKGLERFNGLMEKQSASLSGMASTLKDTVGMGLAGAFAPAIPLLKTVLTDTNTLVTKALPGITRTVGQVTAALGGAYEVFVRGDYNGGWWHQLGVEEDSPIIDKLFRIRDAAMAAFTYLSTTTANIDWSQVWDRITGAIDTARTAFVNVKTALAGVDFASISAGLTSFGQAAGSSSVWSDSLKVAATLLGTALQFLSDHMDTIIKYAPLIVAGYAAWKIAQQGLLVLQVASIPTRIAEVAATFALARANMALAISQGYVRTSRLAAIAAATVDFAIKVKDAAIITLLTIRYIAWQVAIGLVTAATRVAAAGQWLLNAAMTANPIGLVIAAIALLVGGLVWFFTKTEIGRKAWGWLTDKFKEGWAFLNSTLIPGFKVLLSGAIDAAKSKFDTIRDAIGSFITKIKDALLWVGKLGDKLTGGAISKIGNFALDVVGARADGGPVAGGKTYLVGERGPELFTAQRSGSIVNHETLAAVGASTIAVPPVSLRKDDFGLSPADAAGLGRPIQITVVSQLDGREVARNSATHYGDQMARA